MKTDIVRLQALFDAHIAYHFQNENSEVPHPAGYAEHNLLMRLQYAKKDKTALKTLANEFKLNHEILKIQV